MARTVAKDYDEKRLSIVQAAAMVFAQDGFDRASMSSLSKACNFSKAAIYHYYDSKELILFDILETHLSELKDHIFELSRENGETSEDYLSRMILEIMMLYRGRENEHQILMNTNIINNLESKYRKSIIKYQKDIVKRVSSIIHDITPKVFANDPDLLRSSTMSLFAMLNWYSMWNSGRGLNARENYAKFVSDLFINGLKQLEQELGR